MRHILRQYGSFPRSVQLLLLNQLTINLGFYMLIPYLADHLSQGLGLSILLVGLILGVRNFSQQGMFLLGGSLADRFGYKPLIVAGCALRTGGFVLLGIVDNVPTLIIASAATGFAGALFNPAVRAYLARDAGERRVEAFALFSVFYQTGILVGPLIGLALTGIDFSVTCLVAAGVFAVLTVLQVRALPARRGEPDAAPGTGLAPPRESMLGQWREVASTRGFLPFSLAMIGSYVLTYQVYLALPLQARTIIADGSGSTIVVAAVFAVSGGVTIAAQMRVTAWCRARWGPDRSLSRGLAVLAAAFLPLLLADLASMLAPRLVGSLPGVVVAITALLASTAVLALGTAIVFPFEMDTIVALSRERLVATHYGFYNTVCGVGILLGNLGTGWAMDLARSAGLPAAPWAALMAVGGLSAVALASLYRRGLLSGDAGPAAAGTPVADGTARPETGDDPREATGPIDWFASGTPDRGWGESETRPLRRVAAAGGTPPAAGAAARPGRSLPRSTPVAAGLPAPSASSRSPGPDQQTMRRAGLVTAADPARDHSQMGRACGARDDR
ncbi:MFS transporter [Pseudonocardia sp. KRD291]|uniref:MDR family MFS transporter n=1 Tax=Pseudonocardia sp. KRD291 TaxID=2792007 RepID=UPI0027E2EB99|nr:MFS transporter [Pseudonocardia sp. KRD291]